MSFCKNDGEVMVQFFSNPLKSRDVEAIDCSHYGGWDSYLIVFELRSGSQSSRNGMKIVSLVSSHKQMGNGEGRGRARTCGPLGCKFKSQNG